VFSKTEYWDQLPSLSSELKMRRRPGSLFAPGLSLWIFSRDILFRLYRKVSYPSFTPHQAQGTYAIRQESEKRAGEYRENGAREDRDPLQDCE
jgi:hypothetical protein